MKIYQSKNVYEAALERIEWLYREFPNVIVSVSGGKDSTVILHLCIEAAQKLGRLPVIARFLDQEAEWRDTIEYMRQIQDMPEVDLRWYQIEFKIFNATSHSQDWLYCWRKGDKWIRPKEPDAIKENVYGLDRFHDFLEKQLDFDYPNEPACAISGVRCSESPQRAKGLTNFATYKHITWGHKDNHRLNHYTLLGYGEQPKLDPSGKTGLQVPLTVLSSLPNPPKSVLDCCVGLGMTAKVAKKLGMNCYANELNPNRVAKTMKVLDFVLAGKD